VQSIGDQRKTGFAVKAIAKKKLLTRPFCDFCSAQRNNRFWGACGGEGMRLIVRHTFWPHLARLRLETRNPSCAQQKWQP